MKPYIILFLACILFSCGTTTNQVETKEPETYVSHSLDTLSQLINLTNYKPKSVLWTVKKLGIGNDRNPGPTDYNLEAVLSFDDTTINRLKASYKLLSITYMPKSTKIFTFDWLPQTYTFNQDTALDVTYRSDFFAKSPYLNGAFITNNTDVLLSFYTQ